MRSRDWKFSLMVLCALGLASALFYGCGVNAPTAMPIPTATRAAASETPTSAPSAVPATPNAVFVSSLLGLWQGSDDTFYLFNTDGTWHWDKDRAQVETSAAQNGDWWIEGTILNLMDSSGAVVCPQTQIGTYQMDFRNGVLLLGVLRDRCKGRSARTQGMFHKVQR